MNWFYIKRLISVIILLFLSACMAKTPEEIAARQAEYDERRKATSEFASKEFDPLMPYCFAALENKPPLSPKKLLELGYKGPDRVVPAAAYKRSRSTKIIDIMNGSSTTFSFSRNKRCHFVIGNFSGLQSLGKYFINTLKENGYRQVGSIKKGTAIFTKGETKLSFFGQSYGGTASVFITLK